MPRRGFSITELMIAMLLTMLLLGFILQIFSSLSRSVRQTQQLALLQQNGQLALNLLQNELQNSGFFGGMSLGQLREGTSAIIAPDGDCVKVDLDSGSFPVKGQPFINLYAGLAVSGRQLNCLTGLLPQSEYLQLKRAIGLNVAASALRSNRFYLQHDWQQPRFVDLLSPGLDTEASYFPYQHLVFYLQQQTDGRDRFGVLMRKRLVRSTAGDARIHTDSVIDGVERLHFEFGIDATGDGQLNYRLATRQMTDRHWQQIDGRIISITFYVLLRSLQPDRHYINSQRYQMGAERFDAPGDHYRRLLLSSTVSIHHTIR